MENSWTKNSLSSQLSRKVNICVMKGHKAEDIYNAIVNGNNENLNCLKVIGADGTNTNTEHKHRTQTQKIKLG